MSQPIHQQAMHISSKSAMSGLLQRACACGQHNHAGGECAECKKKRPQRKAVTQAESATAPPIVHDVLRFPGQPLDSAVRSSMKLPFVNDFSGVQSHSDPKVADVPPDHRLTFIGGPGANLLTGHNGVFINGPDGGKAPSPNSPTPPPKAQRPPTSAVPNCPTDIIVASVGQENDRDFGRTGPITGWGGFAQMEVSDPSGRNWDGTAIHETLRNIKNTCGDQGSNACSNRSGQGSGAGSTFEVGKESNFLGLGELRANRNIFYDIHAFMKKGSSLLHIINKPSCEIQCEQFYDCGGRRFGPDFVITYSMTRDEIPRKGGGSYAVTRVIVSKAAKTNA